MQMWLMPGNLPRMQPLFILDFSATHVLLDRHLMPVAPLLVVEWSSFDLIGYAPNVIYHVSSVSKIYYVTDLSSLFPFRVKDNFFLNTEWHIYCGPNWVCCWLFYAYYKARTPRIDLKKNRPTKDRFCCFAFVHHWIVDTDHWDRKRGTENNVHCKKKKEQWIWRNCFTSSKVSFW